MGMSEFYGTATRARRSRRSTARSTSASPSSTRPTCTARSRTSSSSAGRSRTGATRSCSRRSSATSATRTAAGSASTAGRSTCARRATRRSQRLGVDHIDLYYQHRVDTDDADRGDGRRDGGARRRRARCATSGCPRRRPETIRRAHAVHPITALQTEYSLWTRDPGGRDPADRARARHRLRRLQPARPRLPLRADQDDRRPRRRTTTAARNPRFQGENFQKNLDLVDAGRGDRGGEGRHARPARARVGARPAATTSSRSRARSASTLPRGERRRGRRRADRRRPRAASTRRSRRASPPATAIPTCRR